MRLSKLLSIITIVTLIALLYVWQQTEVFRLAYAGQKRQSAFQDLLDKNTVLRYNIEKNASLISIGNKVYNCPDFQIPGKYKLVKVGSAGRTSILSGRLTNKENIFVRLFGIKREAQAKTVNP